MTRVKVCCIASLGEALLDSGNPALAIKQLGGTGRTHDGALSRRIRHAIHPLPLWLAGGLGAHNVAAAIAIVRPQRAGPVHRRAHRRASG